MDNYYKILQVDKEATPEIIEKVYKALVKQYHPDLQTDDKQKKNAESKIKKINEAYDVLSDKTKRSEYDKQLSDTTISSEKYNQVMQENIELKNELNVIKSLLYKGTNNVNQSKTTTSSSNYSNNYNQNRTTQANTNNTTNSYYNTNPNNTYRPTSTHHFRQIISYWFNQFLKAILSLLITMAILWFILPHILRYFGIVLNFNLVILIIVSFIIIAFITKK